VARPRLQLRRSPLRRRRLHGATFNGSGTVAFAGTTITDRLSFAGATFAGGIVSFDGARFAGGSICFSGAKFTGGVVGLSKVDEVQPPPASDLWPVDAHVPAGLKLPTTASASTADASDHASV